VEEDEERRDVHFNLVDIAQAVVDEAFEKFNVLREVRGQKMNKDCLVLYQRSALNNLYYLILIVPDKWQFIWMKG
jgi:hypothetical protein